MLEDFSSNLSKDKATLLSLLKHMQCCFVSFDIQITSLSPMELYPSEVAFRVVSRHPHDQRTTVCPWGLGVRVVHILKPFVLEERCLKRQFQQTSLVFVAAGAYERCDQDIIL
ncbi:hypothetical protein Tco_1104799 [Tanacetum coccineum]